jgi:sigma-B regulation protein RsbU (phosphoserine phosphatase)
MKSIGKSQAPLILIVDDDRITTQGLEGLLQGAGFATLSAHDLASGAALARAHDIALILLDVHLPDGSGLDLCAQLMAEPSYAGTPILLISASDDVTIKVRGFAAGAVDYITKPLAGAEVLARVRTHLRLRSAYESLARMHAERVYQLGASQESLMPRPGDLPEAGFSVCMQQAHRAGGDFYDVISVGEGITDFVVADASGHNLSSSLWTAAFKALVSEYASVLHTPKDILNKINHALQRILREGAYFTAVYARLNRRNNKIILASAGHPPAVLIQSEAPEAILCDLAGDVLGVFPDAVFAEKEFSVQPADRLFLCTDGLLEQDMSQIEGIQRLRDACYRATELPLIDAVPGIVGYLYTGSAPDDDIILLGVEV